MTRHDNVAVIGGGAAGMSRAATLANHPDRFKAALLERCDVVGGQATSIPLDEHQYDPPWTNNGISKRAFNFFHQHGYPPQEVQLQQVKQYSDDIKKFGFFLKAIKWTLPILGLVPISIMLRVFLFSKDFGNKMVYPLILFLGARNQTTRVPSAIVERLFDDPNMKLWDYDPVTLLPNLPTNHAKGVTVRTGAEVSGVPSRSGKGVKPRVRDVATGNTTDEGFDEMVLSVLADDSLRILGQQATWREKMVLGGAAFYDDITVTHCDRKYFEKHQLGHRWQHYLRVVPGMMFLHGRNSTHFAGSWTLVVILARC
ncbi:Uncharacterized protein TCAP_04155 [Tolypocladium capitatum]|uniref:FAD/NAD(P)-binding domain-containing protein n=1 Tax=Tolypocladium capitatum TaxID=45235 RepID=A0A2K3QEC9_9HYPO|nr:Uncharacterized protein TCAP_04155 [Tolypocladium capitatum]